MKLCTLVLLKLQYFRPETCHFQGLKLQYFSLESRHFRGLKLQYFRSESGLKTCITWKMPFEHFSLWVIKNLKLHIVWWIKHGVRLFFQCTNALKIWRYINKKLFFTRILKRWIKRWFFLLDSLHRSTGTNPQNVIFKSTNSEILLKNKK